MSNTSDDMEMPPALAALIAGRGAGVTTTVHPAIGWLRPGWMPVETADLADAPATGPVAREAAAPVDAYAQQAMVDFWAISRIAKAGLAALKESPAWQAMDDPAVPASEILTVSGEVLWLVSLFEPARLEAGHAALARLGPGDPRLGFGLTQYLEEEALLIAGIATTATKLCGPLSGPSPAADAIAARWRDLSRTGDPIGLLGAAYCVEAISAGCAAALQTALARRETATCKMRRATEQGHSDAVHAVFLKHLILDVLTRHPEAAAPMREWAEALAPLHPLPLWTEALERARTRASA